MMGQGVCALVPDPPVLPCPPQRLPILRPCVSKQRTGLVCAHPVPPSESQGLDYSSSLSVPTSTLTLLFRVVRAQI
jgi:hypothetical protein